MKKSGCLLCLLILFICHASSFAQTLGWQDSIPPDKAVTRGQLDNGLQFFVQEHHEPAHRAMLKLVVKAGSLQEADDQLGIAHFVEHLAFNGTEHFEKNEIIDFIQRNGSRFGADLNAYTSFDETVYKLYVKTDTPATLDTALLILQDWAAALTFEAAEIEAERGIIIAEWRNRLSSNQRVQEQVYKTLYNHSRYVERLPIGDPELIDTIGRARIVDYYQKWYQPRRMQIIAVGDFDSQWMKKEIETRFAALRNTDQTETQDYPLSEQKQENFRIISDDEKPFTQWHHYIQLDQATANNSIAQTKEGLLYSLYNSMLNLRLLELKKQGDPKFTFAGIHFSNLLANYGSYELSAFAPTADLKAAITNILIENERVVQHGFTKSELEHQKKLRLKHFEESIEEWDKQSVKTLNNRIQQQVKNKGYVSDPHLQLQALKMCLDSITIADVSALSQQWQASLIQHSIITANTAEIDQLPSQKDLQQLQDSVQQLELAPYQPAVLDALIVTPKKQAGSSQLISQDTSLGISHYQLSNGINIYTKATDFKHDQIILQAYSHGGSSLYNDQDFYTAKHLSTLISRSGLGDFSSVEISKLLADKTVNLRATVGDYSEGFHGSCDQKDVKTLFQLLHLHFTQAKIDSMVVANFVKDQRHIFSNIDTDPRSAFGRKVINLKYENHARKPGIELAEIEQINVATAAQIYAERFEDTNDFSFVFVGNINTDSLLHYAHIYLASLDVKRSEEQWQNRKAPLANYAIDTTFIAGKTPKAEVLLEWHQPFVGDAYQRYLLVSLRALLKDKLRKRLREEMGGIYGVSISMSASRIPEQRCHSQIRFNAEVEQVDSLIIALYEELEKIANQDFSKADIDKIKAAQLKSREEYLRNNSFWAYQIMARLKYDTGFESLKMDKYKALVDQLSVPDLAQMAQTYLLDATHFKFVLLPEPEQTQP